MANHACQYHSPACCAGPQKKSSTGLIGRLIQGVLFYAVLVFLGGTLQHTPHPVAVESGKLIHTVTLVEPLTHWADRSDIRPLSMAMRVLANGVNVRGFLA